MSFYVKRADRDIVVIPGVGAVSDGMVIEGNFDRFVPGLLVKVANPAPIAPVPPPPKSIAPVAPATPVVAAKTEIDAEPEVEEALVPDPPSLDWTKAELTVFARGLGLDIKPALSKTDILDLIHASAGGNA